MHDCPGCRVPLHGYEEVCPSCGTRQVVRRSSKGPTFRPAEQGINWIPILLGLAVVVVVIISAIPGSWLGQLMSKKPEPEDPIAKLTYIEARNIIESELNKNLQAVGATAKLDWKKPGGMEPSDKTANEAVELVIDTSLQDKNQRTGIIDPIKPYMEKAQVMTLTMNDKKSHATWTYTVTPGTSSPEPDAGL